MAEIERLGVVGWKDFQSGSIDCGLQFRYQSSQQRHAKYALADSDYCGYGSVTP